MSLKLKCFVFTSQKKNSCKATHYTWILTNPEASQHSSSAESFADRTNQGFHVVSTSAFLNTLGKYLTENKVN